MPDVTRRIRVVVDASGAQKGAQEVTASFHKMEKAAGLLSGGLKLLGGAFIGKNLIDIATATLRAGASFESTMGQLTALTGSVESARREFSKLEGLGISTPFTMDSMTTAFTKLRTRGIEPSQGALQSLANVAVATGNSIETVAGALAGAVDGRYRQLEQLGIRAEEEGDKIKVTFEGVTTTIGSSATDIEKYLTDIGENRFGDAAAKQADTLGGATRQLREEIGGLMTDIAELGAAQGFKSLAQGAQESLASIRAQLRGTAAVFNESGLWGVLTSSSETLRTRGGAGAQVIQDIQGRIAEQQGIIRQNAGWSPDSVAARRQAEIRLRGLQTLAGEQSSLLQRSAADPQSLIDRLTKPSTARSGGTIEEKTDKAVDSTKKLHAAQQQVNAAEEKRQSLLERELELLARQGEHARDMAAIIERLNGGFAADFDRKLQSLQDRRLTPYSSIFDEASPQTLAGLVDHDALRRAGLDVANDNVPRSQNTGALQMQAVGQIVGGGAGRGISQAAGVLQGLSNGNFTGVGGSLGGILTLASTLKQGSGGIRDLVEDAFRKPVKSFGETGDILKDAFKSDGGFAKLLERGAKGAATGAAVAGIGNALGIKMSQTGAQIGGAIGSFIPIPGGSIIGSVAGGLIASLFGKTPRAYTNLQVGADGSIATSSGGSKGRNGAENLAASQQMADAVSSSISSILSAVGGTLRPGSVIGSLGPIDKQFGYATSLTSGGSNKSMVKFDTADAAIEALIRSTFERGLVEGLDSFTQRVLTAPGHSLTEAVDLASRYKSALDLMAESADPIEAAAKKAAGAFDDLIRDMTGFGATSEEIGKIEELRTKALKASLEEQTAGLRAFQDLLSGQGSGVPVLEQLATAQSQYAAMRDAIGTGDFDQAKFTDLGQQVFGLARQIYGTSTSEFQAIRQGLLGDTAGALGATETAFNAAADANKPVVDALQDQNAIAVQNYQALLQSNQYLAAIANAIAAGAQIDPAALQAVNGAVAGAR